VKGLEAGREMAKLLPGPDEVLLFLTKDLADIFSRFEHAVSPEAKAPAHNKTCMVYAQVFVFTR